MNQRPFQTNNPAPINVVKDLVPDQNNLVVDYEWCFPCGQPHDQATYSNGVINQALMVHNAINISSATSSKPNLPNDGASNQQEEPTHDATLLNW